MRELIVLLLAGATATGCGGGGSRPASPPASSPPASPPASSPSASPPAPAPPTLYGQPVSGDGYKLDVAIAAIQRAIDSGDITNTDRFHSTSDSFDADFEVGEHTAWGIWVDEGRSGVTYGGFAARETGPPSPSLVGYTYQGRAYGNLRKGNDYVRTRSDVTLKIRPGASRITSFELSNTFTREGVRESAGDTGEIELVPGDSLGLPEPGQEPNGSINVWSIFYGDEVVGQWERYGDELYDTRIEYHGAFGAKRQ